MILKKTNKKLLFSELRKISSFYGCKLFIKKGAGGRYHKGSIWIGSDDSNNSIIRFFCHELAHHQNTIEGNHPVYHKLSDVSKGVRIYGHRRYCIILLNAEVFTEKVGRKICGDWFPGVKYRPFYKNNKYCKSWVDGYCWSLR